MRIGFCLPQRFCRLTTIVLSVACLAVCGVAAPASAASLDIPAWTFDRGNTRVSVNPYQYADYRDKHPGLMLTADDQTPWVVEYDVEFPVDGTYTLHVRYASPEPRPVDVSLDGRGVGKCCGRATGDAPPYPDRHPRHDRPRYRRNFHGAEWEEACKLSATKGKHTLKLTRQGPPPGVIRLRLDSSAAFPKGWKPAERKVQLDKIPPRYRSVFLPPGSVNVATLRLAIDDAIAEFGPRYAKGPLYLKQLAELEKRQKTAGNGLAALRRRAMLDHPLLKFDKLLFVKRITETTGHIYEDPYGGTTLGGNLCILSPVVPGGKVTEIAPQLSGGLFGRFDLSFDAKRVVFAYKKDLGSCYRIYEIGVDGNRLRQLTFDAPDEPDTIDRFGGKAQRLGRGFDDIDPCYLPNGKIMFASTRSQRVVFCLGTSVTTLFAMDANGRNLHCVSEGPITEIDPAVMNDGRVIYMRWARLLPILGGYGAWAK